MDNADTPTARQVKAGRALLAWTQNDLARAAGIATSTLADFERGQRVPVANNVLAIKAALETKGIKFLAGGAVTGPIDRKIVAPAAGGQTLRWVTAEDLSQWAARRDGPAALPELISRLIVISCGPVALRFPADESIQHAGWDGFCETSIATAFVPQGRSVWELGAQRQRIERKAEEDYRKRSERSLGVDPAETTYVFVTPHRWPHKDEWAAAKRAEGVWKDVRVLDGDSLVHWLELHAGVAEWFAVRTGRRPNGLRNLTEVWREWSLATTPALSTELVCADRDDEAVRLLRWLNAEPSIMAVQAEAVDEAVAFLYAAVDPLPDPDRLYWLSRIVVADSEAVAREISRLSAKLVVVLTSGDPGLAGLLAQEGHHVFAAFGSDVGTPANVMRLPRAWRHTIETILDEAGVEQMEARRLARDAGRSLAVLRRLMPAAPTQRPAWAQAPISTALLGAMLAGAWDRAYPVDRAILSRLCCASYDEAEAILAPFAAKLDGPLRRSGSVWKLTSLRDAWFLLAGQLTIAQIDLLIVSFLEVLGEANQAYDDRDRRWKLDRSPPKHASPNLRRGLSEALIALSVYSDRAAGIPDAHYRTPSAVKKLLDGANERLWWSLSHDFRRLAEAAPDPFLEAIEQALAADPCPMSSLFRSDEGFLHDTEYLADLLWALEILCWSADYVGRATLILARLAAIDPGGKMSNRPKETLARIFLPWRPQTFATAAERIQLIDRILVNLPEVGWNLLHAIAPTGRGVTRPTSKPLWRDFSTDEPEALTNRSLHHMYGAIGDRLLDTAGADGDRWAVVLDHWPSFDPTWRERAYERLVAAAPTFPEGQRLSFRETLRSFIAKHAGFPTAEWSLKDDELAPLRSIFEALEPTSASLRNAWLFGQESLRFDATLGWQEQADRLETAQIAAFEEIIDELSVPALIDYALTLERPDSLGVAAALSEADSATKEALLAEAFSRDKRVGERFAQGLLFGFKKLGGEDKLRARLTAAIADHRPASELLAIAFVLDAKRSNWMLIAEAGDEVERAYWSRLNVYAVPADEDIAWITDKFLSVERGRSLLRFVAGHESIEMPADILLTILKHPSTIQEAPNEGSNADGGMFSWYVGKVFERLDTIGGLDHELINLEWIYFQALEHSQRPAKSLEKALSEDPNFFVMLLKTLYSASTEEDDDTSAPAEATVTQAFQVLEAWRRVPGSDDDGVIDRAKLLAWVRAARIACAAAHRTQIADYKIGVILSAATRVNGEAWPPEGVRDVLEEVANDDIDQGFTIGLYNRRGMTTRMPTDGGDQERDLAARYRSDAKSSALLWPRTRAVLERIAAGYEADAEREDQSAEQRDWY
ncbi:helix-turn-helix domain-containing protein [Inquilinus sp. YAF38]|uniref:helix-turn-helix domain-containing protein n=1 Tax=Inquilinus sp. YAF38 TaxID=3233084 RepID=UPI003F8FE39A